MASVSFEDVGKTYSDGTIAVRNLDLEIADGDFMVLVGPSGCGKTTALRMIAGLEDITSGVIRIGETAVNDIESRRRDIAMVFQNYALYPHMTVFDNMAFPLRARGTPKSEIRQRVTETANLLGMSEMLGRRPSMLSGGQRQRVAMGRAIVRKPTVFLMDEPLSNLDAKLRAQMRAEIARLQHDLGTTTLYVTHDQVEAMTMGTRIAIMRKGVLQQQGTPQELFTDPVNLFVASFIGSPAMNLFTAHVERSNNDLVCRTLDQEISFPGGAGQLERFVGGDVVVGVRPDYLELGAGSGDVPSLQATVTLVEMLGSEQLLHAEIAAAPVLTEEVLEVARDIDGTAAQALRVEAGTGRVSVVARVSAKTRVRVGETVSLSAAPESWHFFDSVTGAAITYSVTGAAIT